MSRSTKHTAEARDRLVVPVVEVVTGVDGEGVLELADVRFATVDGSARRAVLWKSYHGAGRFVEVLVVVIDARGFRPNTCGT